MHGMNGEPIPLLYKPTYPFTSWHYKNRCFEFLKPDIGMLDQDLIDPPFVSPHCLRLLTK